MSGYDFDPEWLESNPESSRDFTPSGMEDAVSDASDALYHWSLYLLTLSRRRTSRSRVAALKPHVDELLAAREQLNQAIRRLRKDFAKELT